ncbi:Peptide-methionine (S)-S-oxide reductase [Chytridiales sp. JEL 0842]|nr:Peptide-methionine (S)-S-oxide reductase [Chytridiales sp. JEL 0842]
MAKQIATLGSGCFWGVEKSFRRKFGASISNVQVGYSGGSKVNPTYREVCTGNTGHAEVIQFEYDEDKTPFAVLLDFFFRSHDATHLNFQGPDRGTQYRSVILVHNDHQKKIAEEQLKRVSVAYATAPVVTTIEIFKEFYPAEDYHQDYLEKNPTGYECPTHFERSWEKIAAEFKGQVPANLISTLVVALFSAFLYSDAATVAWFSSLRTTQPSPTHPSTYMPLNSPTCPHHPPSKNLWLILPTELHSHILDLSSPLTQHLNSHIPPPSSTSVWVEAFKTSWDGDLALLPHTEQGIPFGLPHTRNGLLEVKDRGFWGRLLALNGLDKLDMFGDHWNISTLEPELRGLWHVPMRQGWWDLIPPLNGDDDDDGWDGSNCASTDAMDLLVSNAILGNHVPYLHHLLSKIPSLNLRSLRYPNLKSEIQDPITLAASTAHIETTLFLLSHLGSQALTRTAVQRAAYAGSVDILHTFHQTESTYFGPDTYMFGCMSGSLPVIEFLHGLQIPASTLAMNIAAEHGHLRIVEFLHEHRSEGCTTSGLDSAIANGHLEVVKFLIERRGVGFSREGKAIQRAAGRGHVHVLRYLVGSALWGLCNDFEGLAVNACWGGQIEVLKFFKESGFERAFDGGNLMEAAIKGGSLECVRYLEDVRGGEWENVCAFGGWKGGSGDGAKGYSSP